MLYERKALLVCKLKMWISALLKFNCNIQLLCHIVLLMHLLKKIPSL